MSARYSWELSSVENSELATSMSLLSMRNGQQLSPPVNSISVEDDASSASESSAETSKPCQIANSARTNLKKGFLDRCAEVISNRKGPRYVACAVLQEFEDHVVIRVSRNDGFQKADRVFLRSFESTMAHIADAKPNEEHLNDLWKLLVNHYCERLGNYMKSLTIELLNTSDGTPEPSEGLPTSLADLCRALKESNPGEASRRALQINLSPSEEQALIIQLGKRTSHVLRDIDLLTRLSRAQRTFIDIVHELPCFSRIKIVQAQRLGNPPHTPTSYMPLAKMFEILDLPLNNVNVQQVVHRRLNVASTQELLTVLQKQSIHVHAEVQICKHLAQSLVPFDDIFQYVGCSKLSCFMCKIFLDAFCGLETRGCHGKLYSKWTIPAIDNITQPIMKKLQQTTTVLRKTLIHELLKPISHAAHIAESTAGTSILSGSHASPYRARAIAELHARDEYTLLRQRQRIAIGGVNWAEASINAEPSHESDETLLSKNLEGSCMVCQHLTVRRCSRCSADFFCSRACEEKDDLSSVIEHRVGKCTRHVSAAQRLWVSCIRDLVPDDEKALAEFRFNNFPSSWEKRCLLGVYVGILVHIEVKASLLDEWKQDGVLAQNILREFERLPLGSRGSYYLWLKDNLEQLNLPPAEDLDHSDFFDRACQVLEHRDRNLPMESLQPEAKRDAFVSSRPVIRPTQPKRCG